MSYIISTLPEEWCIDSLKFKSTYSANKIYLGRQNNLSRGTVVALEWLFKTEEEQKAFFDWWIGSTDSGGIPFYAKLPIFGDNNYYLLLQDKAFTQIVYPFYKISGQFILFKNKTKDHNAAPVTKDVVSLVEEDSLNNVILLDIEDPDGDLIINVEIVGDDTGVTIKRLSIVYDPPAGFIGSKTLQYRASDGTAWSNISDIIINVKEIDAPIALNIDVDVSRDVGIPSDTGERNISLMGSDEQNRPLTYTIVTGSSRVSIPDEDEPIAIVNVTSASEIVSFTYKVNNGYKDSLPATGTVNTVDPIPLTTVLANIMPESLKLPNSWVDINTLLVGRLVDEDDYNRTIITYTVENVSYPSGVDYAEVVYIRGDGQPSLEPKIKIKMEDGVNESSTFDLLIAADNQVEEHTFTIPVTVLNTKSSLRYEQILGFNIKYIDISGAIPYTKQFNLHPLSNVSGYPENADFPDVLYWNTSGTLDKIKDIYIKWELINGSAEGWGSTDINDSYGVLYTTNRSDFESDTIVIKASSGDPLKYLEASYIMTKAT